MLPTVLAGLATGLSLIVAIGAQNAYVLRQGLRRSHIGAVILVCAVSDVVLIAAGVGGVGALVERAGWMVEVVRWFGVAFLLWYAIGSMRRAFGKESLALDAPGANGDEPLAAVTGRAAALTWLNPHVYLDTVLLVGSIAAAHDSDVTGGRWWFGLGAAVASVLWFTGLGLASRLLAPLLRSPAAWRVLEIVIAATMVVVAVKLMAG